MGPRLLIIAVVVVVVAIVVVVVVIVIVTTATTATTGIYLSSRASGATHSNSNWSCEWVEHSLIFLLGWALVSEGGKRLDLINLGLLNVGILGLLRIFLARC